MSENPYQSATNLQNPPGATPHGAPGSIPQKKPVGLTAIPVICVIFGGLGALMALLGLGALIFPGVVAGLQDMQTDPAMVEYQESMRELQQSLLIPNLILNVCGLIVGSLLAIGSIGVFGLKEWGRNLLRNTFLFAAIFLVLRGVFAIWMQYRSMGMLETMMAAQGNNAEAVAMIMQASAIVGIIIGIAWAIGLAAFYLWSRSYLNKGSVVKYFSTAN